LASKNKYYNEITGLTIIIRFTSIKIINFYRSYNHLEMFQIYTSNLLDDEVHAEKNGYLLEPNSAGNY
jgi:hypothetical protein